MKIFKQISIALLLLIAVQTQGNGIVYNNGKHNVQIKYLDYNIVQVQVSPKEAQEIKKSMVVDEADFPFTDYKLSTNGKMQILNTKTLEVIYDPATDRITFKDKKTGHTILSESSRTFVPVDILGDKSYTVSQTFTLAPDEAIYGLGQFQEGILNYRGQKEYLVHANREIANPVLLSTQNYLLYWDNYSKTLFNDDDSGATFHSEIGDGINYYFIYGTDMNDAVVGFRKLTGEAPMFPKSAFGLWVSRERYKSFDELLGVVKEYRSRNIPMDNIVQDWQYWGTDRNQWNSMRFNPENFDNPEEVIAQLHNELNVKLTLSVWPGVGPETEIYREMDSVGALFDVPTWAGYKVIDIYNPKAQQIYWDQLYKGLYTKGVDSWWMDATEPSFRDGLYQHKQEEWSKKAGMTAIGPFHRYLNTYSLVLSELMYKNLREQTNKRASILTRSAFAGQQKYATSTWSGDIYASWDVFQKQIPAGLNLCMTGIPYWTTDIGGFRVISQERFGAGAGELSDYIDINRRSNDGGYKDGLKDPAYLELYTRWFQYGTFNPMFRIHGTEIPREIWYFGEPGTPYYDAQIKMIDLRYSLLSYIYSNSWQVTSAGATMMRALVMDFTDDKKVHNNAEGFMFGDALLVYPVLRPMFYDRDGAIENPDTQVSMYLPKHNGNYWFDLNADKYYTAGEDISYNAPLDVLPLFAKGGSIVPRNKPAQYANADDCREMEIFIYPGSDATFVLYEDDNETYDYEKGMYSAIKISWNEEKQEVNIDAPTGNLTLLAEREFNFRLVSPEEYGMTSTVSKKILYKNEAVKFKF